MDNIQQPEKEPFSAVDATPQQSHVPAKLAKSWWLRWLYVVLAWLCILIAILGIFIPGLPPFDFLLLASFFAAKGSPRLYRWFQENRYIGPLLREWQQHRRIPRKAKVLSTLSMTCGHNYYLENPTPVVGSDFNCLHAGGTDLDVAQSLSFYKHLMHTHLIHKYRP